VKIIDLTMPLDNATPVYPGDPLPQINQIATIEEQGWNELSLKFNSHCGTHIDAPYHMLADGKKLDEFPIDSFIGSAIVVDGRKRNEKNEIVAGLKQIKAIDFVFFCTGHVKNRYSQKYFENNPVISTKTAQELIEKKIKIAGIDSYTPDNEPFETHKLLFKHQIRIVENLVNLEQLIGKKFECTILPLNIKNADGAPCRVIAILK